MEAPMAKKPGDTPEKPARPSLAVVGKGAKAAKPAREKAEGEKPSAAAKAKEKGNGKGLKKKVLVERVVEKTGAKKSVVRDVTEALLAEIGTALSKGEGINLPPLGKAKVNRHKEKDGGEILVVKFRRGGKGAGKAEESLAEDDE
jgi:DNA-binding protein HU-alpha